jgi:hypothetical protein
MNAVTPPGRVVVAASVILVFVVATGDLLAWMGEPPERVGPALENAA